MECLPLIKLKPLFKMKLNFSYDPRNECLLSLMTAARVQTPPLRPVSFLTAFLWEQHTFPASYFQDPLKTGLPEDD